MTTTTTPAQTALATVYAMGMRADGIDQAALAKFLGSVPATATAAQRIAMAERFEGMIARRQTMQAMSLETLAAAADALRAQTTGAIV